jgi:subtilisin family serine protease
MSVALTADAAGLGVVGLAALMRLTPGIAEVGVGLVDGPVLSGQPDLADARLEFLGPLPGTCRSSRGKACEHATFLAGVLVARRGSVAPALCPGCTLMVRPVFREDADSDQIPQSTPAEIGRGVVDCVGAGARVVNISAAMSRPTVRSEQELRHALDWAAARGAIVVAAAGNQGELGSSELTRHPGVIAVVAYDRARRPLGDSNFAGSIARRGVGAPGDEIVSLGPAGAPISRGGTSVAAAVVSGTIALLWSLVPDAPAGTVRRAVVGPAGRRTVVAPLLDAQASYARLVGTHSMPTPLPLPVRDLSSWRTEH